MITDPGRVIRTKKRQHDSKTRPRPARDGVVVIRTFHLAGDYWGRCKDQEVKR